MTYSGLQQSRLVGNQIGNILEQAKLEWEIRNGETKRRRFRVVIHSSPFLRCIQTSVGISSGLAQTAADSIYMPSDILVPPTTKQPSFNRNCDKPKAATLRIDSFLGEWLSPEYFENITPPPGPALMLGSAKAELLRREDYSAYDDVVEAPKPAPAPTRHNSLWQASPTLGPVGEDGGPFKLSALTGALPNQSEKKKGYAPPRPIYPASGSGRIPDGFVAHARDSCVDIDYQWDSMRSPLDFGDGGKYGEEWTAMHKRFRRGIRKLLNWYATNEPSDTGKNPVTIPSSYGSAIIDEDEPEEIETVVILVSHGAGCNAMMGAITHQPVLMDVSLASITMAVRRPDLDYEGLLSVAPIHELDSTPRVAVDKMYETRMSASTEHLRTSSSSTPVSARSGNVWNPPTRGRTSTFSSSGGPVMSPFSYNDPFASTTSRSSSANAAMGQLLHRKSSQKLSRGRVVSGPTGSRNSSPSTGSASNGLWAPAPSSLREVDSSSDSEDEFEGILPDFNQSRFKLETIQDLPSPVTPTSFLMDRKSPFPSPSLAGYAGPMVSAPIRIHTDFREEREPVQEAKVTQLGGGLGGLWGQPLPPSDADKNRDSSHTKRRWTVTAPAK